MNSWSSKTRWARKCGLLLGLCLALAALPAGAADDPPTTTLDEMTVISTQPGVDITPEKTVIKMDEFQRPAGVRTLTDVLTEIGGVDVQRINPLMSSPGDEVSMRGLNEGRMVIEIDGRRLHHTGHMGRYIVDWSTINMDDVERIEIIRGGHSVLHPFAIGGVINIITKKGKKTDEIKPDARAEVGYGSFETRYGTFQLTGGVANFVGYNITASDNATDGYLRNNFQKNKNINGHVIFYLPKDMTLSYSVKHANVEYGYPVVNNPALSTYDPDYPTFLGSADQLRHVPPVTQPAGLNTPYWDRDVTYQDLIFKAPLLGGEFKLHGFSTEGKRWNHYYRAGEYIEDYSSDLTRGVIAQLHDIPLGQHHRFTAGVEFQELGTPDEENSTLGYPELASATYRVLSFYAQDVMRYGRWTVTPGLRYYHLDINTYYAWFETGGATVDWPTLGKSMEEEDWYPSLKLDFQATPTTALYAAASRSTRLPCPCDYYWWARCANTNNKPLEPESAWEYEVGVIQDWKPVTVRAAAFYYDIENFINDNGITAPGTGLGSNCLYNIDQVTLYGFEVEGSVRLGKGFQATASYTYQEVNADETKYDADWTYYLPTLLPKHKVKVLARYEAWKDGFLQLSGRFMGERQAQKGDTLDAYFVVDAGVEQRLQLPGVELNASLYVSNALGEEYEEQAGFEMPKQVVGFRLGARF